MFKNLLTKFTTLYNKQIDGKGLAIFRIVFSIVFLGEVIQLAYFQHLIFDKIPYLIPGEIEMWPVFLFWIISILFLIFGLFTRVAAIINYVLTVVVLGTISSFEYHMFYSYIIVNFLFIFIPVSRTLSLDRLLLKLKYSNTGFHYKPPQTVSAISYYIPVLLGVGFIYFDSVFFKLSSPLWLRGLGLWLPGSLPEAVIFNNSFLLNLKYLIIALGYLTLIFETIFLFVFWRKKWRMPVLILGIGLHLGILMFFPIPFFALGVVAIYILMIPVSLWDIFFKQREALQKQTKFYYDSNSLSGNRTAIILGHFGVNRYIEFIPFQKNDNNDPALKNSSNNYLTEVYSIDRKNKVYTGWDSFIRMLNVIWYLKPVSWILRCPGIYHIARGLYNYTAINCTKELYKENNSEPTNFTLRQLKVKTLFWSLIFFSIVQLIVTYTSPLSKLLRQKMGVSELKVVKISESISNNVTDFSGVFWGISHHGVFVDSHFAGYNHDIAVVYVSPAGSEKWLPIISKKGTPGSYLFGPVWAKWTFRVDGPLVNQDKLTNGIRDFTAFWAHKNGISLKGAVFKIRVKKNQEPKYWEYNFLNRQLQNPWLDAGQVTWKDNLYYPDLKIIEKM